MSNILTRPVLVLNKNWTPVDETTVAHAITDMTGSPPSKLAMHIEMEKDENGNWQLSSGTRPMLWDEWIAQEIRDDHHGDAVIRAHRFHFRAPTVVICAVYDKMSLRSPRLSASAIWERDKGICQYTGKKVSRNSGNLDHVVPRDRGGKDSWENMVVADRDLNSLKGNRLNHEVGLTLIRQPKRPPSLPPSAFIESRHVTWEPFLIRQ